LGLQAFQKLDCVLWHLAVAVFPMVDAVQGDPQGLRGQGAAGLLGVGREKLFPALSELITGHRLFTFLKLFKASSISPSTRCR